MDITYSRCAGLDVHKKTVVACVITPNAKTTRTFSTMTGGLLEMADWLVEQEMTHVAMESTGVYWKPIYNLLEGLELELLVVNAKHIKAVPGRKTDVKDAEWIADLLRHGLLRSSYIPDRPQRELRELVRYRRNLVRQRSQVVNRIQQVLEGANIKLSSVATDITGVSGRAMLHAMADGQEEPQAGPRAVAPEKPGAGSLLAGIDGASSALAPAEPTPSSRLPGPGDRPAGPGGGGTLGPF